MVSAAFAWESAAKRPPADAFVGVDAVVHLAGESVVGRWSDAKREAIRSSRLQSTSNLVKALSEVDARPATLISANAIGYYGDRGGEELDEQSVGGDDFLASVAADWQEAAAAAESLGMRSVQLRIGIVLGPGGGALDAMLTPFKLGVGGPLGSGRQWWSWIALDDLVGMIRHLLESELSGPVNATAPQPVRQKEFARTLGRVLSRPAIMPAPAFVLKMVLGEFATELLSSKRVMPSAALRDGYRFVHPELESCLRDALE